MMRSPTRKKTAQLNHDCGPNLRKGSDDAVWAINPWSAAAHSRFDQFVRSLPNCFFGTQPSVTFLLCAIGYDCILSESDLVALGKLASKTFDHDQSYRVTWISDQTGGQHTEARCMSLRTRFAASQISPDVDWMSAMADLEVLLLRIYPDAVLAVRSTALELVLTDAKTWWYWHLPLCLYSHVRGLCRMPILDDYVLRRIKDLPVSSTADSLEVEPTLDHAHDAVTDRLFALPSNDTPRVSQQASALIQSIFSVSSNQAGLRLATHLNSRELRDKLVLVTEMVRNEGWTTAVLLSWAIHLLSVGSIRKVNPAVSTLSAYISALLAPLAEALYELKYPPVCYAQQDWVRLFDLLRQRATTGQHTAALASLHSWAVRTHGCDPMPEVMFLNVEETRVHANLVWPSEQQRALGYAINASADERVSHQVQVLLALGSGGLFRAGELPGLLVRDLVLEASVLYVSLNPGRGLHGGKSRAARRIVRIHNQALINIVWAWRERRNLESGSDSKMPVFMFGDPHNSRQLYKIGNCVRLANELLRRATGDDRVSFHSLRHTNASTRAYFLMAEPQVAREVSPLDELCFELGHSSRKTLWSTYFHFPEYAIRAVSDRIEAAGHFSATETAKWLNISPSAARQRASRIASDLKLTSDLYKDWLRCRVDADGLSFSELLKSSAPSPAMTPLGSPCATRNLRWVRQALSAIGNDASLESLCLRLSSGPQEVVSLCLAVQDAISPIKRAGRTHPLGLLLPTSNAEHALQWSRLQIANHQFRFDPGGNTILTDFATHLERVGNESMARQATQAWTVMLRHNVLSLHDPGATQQLLKLLRSAGFPADVLVIRVQSNKPNTENHWQIRSNVSELAQRFVFDFGAPVRVEQVQPRRGYPLRYLVVSRNHIEPGLCAPSAAVRMHEFHGLFFSLAVFHSFQRNRVSHE